MTQYSLVRSVAIVAAIAGSLVAETTTMEQIVAKINGEIITKSEIDHTRKQLREALIAAKTPPQDLDKLVHEREKEILRDKIDQMLLVQKGKELSINVDNEVTKQIAQYMRQSGVTSLDKFQELIHQETGQAFEDWKADLRNSLLTRRVIGQEVSSKISINKSELQKYYDGHKAEFQREERVFMRELFLSTEGKDAAAQAAVEKKAKDLVARARKGEKFGDLARDNSDADTAKQDGELPPYKKGEMNKTLEDLVWKADRGTVTDPIRLPGGWMILKVEEHHQAGLAAFDEVENEIMNRLFEPRMQPKVREYLTKLREDAFLEIREGYEDASPATKKSTSWSDPAVLKPETITKEEVAAQKKHKRLLWAVPLPGTSTANRSTSKS